MENEPADNIEAVKRALKSKDEIVHNWLPRYTGRKIEDFGKYILLTNFSGYLDLFSKIGRAHV